MERRIAKALKGNRTPSSGAMFHSKGDVKVSMTVGHYLIECKLSSQHHDTDPQIKLVFDWFTKHQKDVVSMGSSFGIFIIHYTNYKGDYVLIRRKDIESLLGSHQIPFASTIRRLLDTEYILQTSHTLAGKPRTMYNLRKSEITTNCSTIDMIKGMRISFPDAEYLLLDFEVWRTISNYL